MGLILFDEQLTWFDVSNEDFFDEECTEYFPSDFKTAEDQPAPIISSKLATSPTPAFDLDASLDLETFDFDSFTCVSLQVGSTSPNPKPDSSNE